MRVFDHVSCMMTSGGHDRRPTRDSEDCRLVAIPSSTQTPAQPALLSHRAQGPRARTLTSRRGSSSRWWNRMLRWRHRLVVLWQRAPVADLATHRHCKREEAWWADRLIRPLCKRGVHHPLRADEPQGESNRDPLGVDCLRAHSSTPCLLGRNETGFPIVAWARAVVYDRGRTAGCSTPRFPMELFCLQGWAESCVNRVVLLRGAHSGREMAHSTEGRATRDRRATLARRPRGHCPDRCGGAR